MNLQRAATLWLLVVGLPSLAWLLSGDDKTIAVSTTMSCIILGFGSTLLGLAGYTTEPGKTDIDTQPQNLNTNANQLAILTKDHAIGQNGKLGGKVSTLALVGALVMGGSAWAWAPFPAIKLKREEAAQVLKARLDLKERNRIITLFQAKPVQGKGGTLLPGKIILKQPQLDIEEVNR